jgi:hypothetical protein
MRPPAGEKAAMIRHSEIVIFGQLHPFFFTETPFAETFWKLTPYRRWGNSSAALLKWRRKIKFRRPSLFAL